MLRENDFQQESYIQKNYPPDVKQNKNILISEFRCGSVETNSTSIHEDSGSIPGLAQWVEDPALP